jgi:hypothetical protein
MDQHFEDSRESQDQHFEDSRESQNDNQHQIPTVSSQKRLSTDDRARRLKESSVSKKVKVTTLHDLSKLMEDEDEDKNQDKDKES